MLYFFLLLPYCTQSLLRYTPYHTIPYYTGGSCACSFDSISFPQRLGLFYSCHGSLLSRTDPGVRTCTPLLCDTPAEYRRREGSRGAVVIRHRYREARRVCAAVRAEDNGGCLRVHAAHDHAQLRGDSSNSSDEAVVVFCFLMHLSFFCRSTAYACMRFVAVRVDARFGETSCHVFPELFLCLPSRGKSQSRVVAR